MTHKALILIVDDDAAIRDSLRMLLESAGHTVRCYKSAKALLDDDVAAGACLIADIRMPEMDGLELQQEIMRRGLTIPFIVMTGYADVPLALRAMKAGVADFVEKPFDPDLMLQSVQNAISLTARARSRAAEARAAQEMLALLTPRERAVFDQIVAGRSNKVAAHALHISPRTVEVHRAHIMDKTKMRSLSDLVRISMVASGHDS
jgi:two-component system response regulator FixJ